MWESKSQIGKKKKKKTTTTMNQYNVIKEKRKKEWRLAFEIIFIVDLSRKQLFLKIKSQRQC